MKKTVLAMAIVALFIGMTFIPVGVSIETKVSENEEQVNILSEPDYEFKYATIRLLKGGKCRAWSAPGDGYTRTLCHIPIFPFWNIAFYIGFGHGIGRGKPGVRLELIEGVLMIDSPDGEPCSIKLRDEGYIEYATFIGFKTWKPEDNNLYDYYKGKVYGLWVYK